MSVDCSQMATGTNTYMTTISLPSDLPPREKLRTIFTSDDFLSTVRSRKDMVTQNLLVFTEQNNSETRRASPCEMLLYHFWRIDVKPLNNDIYDHPRLYQRLHKYSVVKTFQFSNNSNCTLVKYENNRSRSFSLNQPIAAIL